MHRLTMDNATVMHNAAEHWHLDVKATLRHVRVNFPAPLARAAVGSSQIPMARNHYLSFCLSLPLPVHLFLCLSSLVFSFNLDIAGITTFAIPRVRDVTPVGLHLDLGLSGRKGTWTPPGDDTGATLRLVDTTLRPMKSYATEASEPWSASAGTPPREVMDGSLHAVIIIVTIMIIIMMMMIIVIVIIVVVVVILIIIIMIIILIRLPATTPGRATLGS